MKSLLLILASLALLQEALSCKNTKTFQKLSEAQISPSLVDDVPHKSLTLTYSSVEIGIGEDVAADVVANAPKFSFRAHAPSLYTLVMVDPDAANPQALHWLVLNIKGSDLTTGLELVEYAAPSANTPVHKYVLLVYKQKGNLNIPAPQPDAFNVKQFAQANNLGNPIYGNYFQVKEDPTFI